MTGDAKREVASAAALLGASGCTGAVEKAADLLDDGERRRLRDMKILSVKITGNTAVVRTTADDVGGDGSQPTRLRKVDGDWLIDADDEG
jgi:hypothetical protein